jgi:hypothetical protein
MIGVSDAVLATAQPVVMIEVVAKISANAPNALVL